MRMVKDKNDFKKIIILIIIVIIMIFLILGYIFKK